MSTEEKIIFGKYKTQNKLGEGSFGKIYSAVNLQTGENFALKFEQRSANHNLLELEACILRYLQAPGIPFVKSYGYKDDDNILVMELLGKSLEDLFQDCKKKLSLKTVCMLADQMIKRVEWVHEKALIHRDIKPDNFVMGIGDNQSMVYIIDFGLSKKFRSSRSYHHIPFVTNKKLTGTARYASINALSGFEQSRRDDLESIGYVLIYLLKGSLPWQGLKVDKDEDRYHKILEKKKQISPENLCEGLPEEFVEYINYCRNLDFEEEPDYRYLRGLFKNLLKTNNLQYDYQWDWLIKNNKNKEENNNNKINNIHSNNVNDSNKKIPQNNVIVNSNNNLTTINNLNANNISNQNKLITLNATSNNNQNSSNNNNNTNKVKTRMSVNNSNTNLMNSSSNVNLNFNANSSIGNNFQNTNVLNKVNSMTNINKNALGKKNSLGYKNTINTNLNFNNFTLNNPLNTKTSASATKMNRNYPFEVSSNTNQKNGFNYGYNLNQLRGSNGFTNGNNDLGPKSNKNASVTHFKNPKI